MKFRIALPILLLAALVVSYSWPDRSSQNAVRASTSPATATRGPIVAVSTMTDFDAQAAIEEEQARVVVYLAEQARLEEERRLAAEEAERIRVAEEAAARRAVVSVAGRGSSGAVVSGDCAEVAAVVGAGTVQRESGGRPGATNGIYLGCAQIGMPWWNGACSGLDWHNVSDQAECARIVLRLQGPSAWATTWGG